MYFLYRSGMVLDTSESKKNNKWNLDPNIHIQGGMIYM